MKTIIQNTLVKILMWVLSCKTYMRVALVLSLVWNIMILPVHIILAVASRHPKMYFENFWWSVKTSWKWFAR